MPKRISCTELVNYDPQANQYIACGTVISYDPAKPSETITCPSCGSQVSTTENTEKTIQSPAKQSNKSKSQQPSALGGAVPSHAKLERSRAADEGQQNAKVRGKAANESAALRTDSESRSQTASARVMSARRHSETSGRHPTQDPRQPQPIQLDYYQYDPNSCCHKCGTRLPDDSRTCPRCRTTTDLPDKDPIWSSCDVKPTGLSYAWNKVSNGKANSTFTYALAGFILIWISSGIIYIGYSIAFLIGLILTTPWVAACCYAYFRGIWHLKCMRKDPTLELLPWQRWWWNQKMLVARATEWRLLVAKPVIADMRGKDLLQCSLAELEVIKTANVADFEGAKLTDKELRTLRTSKHLRMINLCNTDVTAEGVFHLQQSIPRAFVWY